MFIMLHILMWKKKDILILYIIVQLKVVPCTVVNRE